MTNLGTKRRALTQSRARRSERITRFEWLERRLLLFAQDIWLVPPGVETIPTHNSTLQSEQSAVTENRSQTVGFDPYRRIETVSPVTIQPASTNVDLIQSNSGRIPDIKVWSEDSSLGSINSLRDDAKNERAYNPRNVHGDDDRTRVDDTNHWPYRAVGRLRTEFPNGWRGHCSGAMIGAFHFLTAGHCVHNEERGGWASNLTVSLGQDLAERYFGVANSQYVRSYSGWIEFEDAQDDWALVTLDRNLGSHTGWIGYESQASSDSYLGMEVATAGYPGDLESGRAMYEASGTTSYATETRVYYSGLDGLDTAGGQSGSSVWRRDPVDGEYYVNVVHAYGSPSLNSGTRINAEKFQSLQDWIAEDELVRTPTDYSDLVDRDDWFGSTNATFSPMVVAPGESFSASSEVRNNGTANAGPFNVEFRLSTDTIFDPSDRAMRFSRKRFITRSLPGRDGIHCRGCPIEHPSRHVLPCVVDRLDKFGDGICGIQ